MFAHLLLAALAAGSVSFDSDDTIEKRGAFFLSQANEQGARVKALKPTAKNSKEPACRRALTLPEQVRLKASLEQKLNLNIPDEVHFIDAEIQNYQQRKKGQWLICTGEVTLKSYEKNEAFLALKLAWHFVKKQQKNQLRNVLSIPLKHSESKNDALALIASQSPANKGLAYSDKHLSPELLRLPESIYAVAKMWFEAQRIDQALSLISGCNTTECKHLKLKIEEALEARENEQADDLGRYF